MNAKARPPARPPGLPPTTIRISPSKESRTDTTRFSINHLQPSKNENFNIKFTSTSNSTKLNLFFFDAVQRQRATERSIFANEQANGHCRTRNNSLCALASRFSMISRNANTMWPAENCAKMSCLCLHSDAFLAIKTGDSMYAWMYGVCYRSFIATTNKLIDLDHIRHTSPRRRRQKFNIKEY